MYSSYKQHKVDNTKDLDVVIPIYDWIECSYNYSKTTGSWQQYCKNEQRNPITESNSFKSKSRFSYNANEYVIINAEIAVPLNYLNSFWRTIEMLYLIAKLILLQLCHQKLPFLKVTEQQILQ